MGKIGANLLLPKVQNIAQSGHTGGRQYKKLTTVHLKRYTLLT